MKRHSANTGSLGEFEQAVLLALMRLGPDAYGATIHRELEERLERSVSHGAVYATLDRLEVKGYLRSRVGDPTPQRGGRRRKHCQLTPSGARALSRSYRDFMRMVGGLERKLELT